jgi:hypothetical protein
MMFGILSITLHDIIPDVRCQRVNVIKVKKGGGFWALSVDLGNEKFMKEFQSGNLKGKERSRGIAGE